MENIKAYFNHKGRNSTKITLVEKHMIITNEKQIAKMMNEKLNHRKAKFSSTFSSIQVTTIKEFVDVYLFQLTNSINHSLRAGVFPQKLKQADVFPLNKTLDPLKEEKYRLVSLLPHLLKVFEKTVLWGSE